MDDLQGILSTYRTENIALRTFVSALVLAHPDPQAALAFLAQQLDNLTTAGLYSAVLPDEELAEISAVGARLLAELGHAPR